MLDADSVFERLLREATNLVPKMSTPKLTAALKESSILQQRITDTLSSRLRQEQCTGTAIPAKSFGVQGAQSFVGAPLISEELVSDNPFLSSGEAFPSRTVTSAGYAAIPFFPQLNQFAVSQRAATLVTITSPHGGTTTGAVVGTLGPPPSQVTPIAPVSTAQPVILPLQTTPQSSDPAALQSSPPPTSSKPDGSCDPCPPLITTTAGAVSASSACGPNGHIITASGLECVDMKPDPVACLSRVSADEPPAIFATHSTTSNVSGEFGASTNTQLNFLSATASAAPVESLPSSPPVSTTTSSDSVVVPITAASVAATAPSTTAVVATTPATVVVMKTTSGNEGDSGGGGGGGGGPTGGGPYQCMHCGKEFRVLRYLEKHKRIHTGEKPYQCCFCGRLFNDWPNMNRHKRIHTGERPYRCSVCTKTFSQPAVYNEHVKRHTGERPYVCTVCSKGFPRAARLVVHMRVHTGEKPYRCHVCDRRFSQPHHLSTHIRIHSEDRPFRFSLRDGTASGSANSRRHRRQANHPTDPIVPAAAAATPSQGTRVKHLSDPSATEASPTGGQRKILAADAGGSAGNDDSSGVCSGESAVHPESSESLLSQDGELQASTGSSLEASRDAGGGEGVSLPTSTPLSASAVTVGSPGTAEATRATPTPNPAVAVTAAGLNVSEDFCSQPPPSIFDANGTIYISTVDGTAAISGGGTTALVPATTTITSTLPQIQIHPQAQSATAAFATTAAAFSGDPHQLQPQAPIQICYSTSPAATASPNTADPTTIILPSSSKPQMFGPMLVPIGTASAPTPLSPPPSLTPAFPYATTAAAAVNPPAAFQTTHTLPSQAGVTKAEAVTSTNASLEASTITADV